MPRVEGLTLPHRPPDGRLDRLAVRALYFQGLIDPKQFRTRNAAYPVVAADPLIVAPADGSFVALAKFGVVVLWNCDDDVQRAVVEAVRALPGVPSGPAHEDGFEVVVGSPENRVTFDDVGLRKLTLEQLKVISLALAQSVALDHIESEVARALAGFEPVVQELRASGRLHLGERQVLRAVGFALSVRQDVLANLTLFDKPPETWESEALDRLDTQLYDFFDLEERLSAVNQKIAYFSEMNARILDLLNHRKSVRLEWIIILLIVIEVILFVAVDVMP